MSDDEKRHVCLGQAERLLAVFRRLRKEGSCDPVPMFDGAILEWYPHWRIGEFQISPNTIYRLKE